MSTPRPRAVAALAVLLATVAAAPARAADTIPGQVVAKFAAGQRAAAIDRAGIDIDGVRSLKGVPGTAVVDLAPGQSVADAVRELNDTHGVVYAQPDYRVHAFATPNDPSFRSTPGHTALFQGQWGLDNVGQNIGGTGLPPDVGTPDADIDAPEAWDLSTGSRSVKIGIVDTGVDLNHEDLAANEWVNPGEIAGNGVDDDHNGFVDDTRGWNFALDDNNPGWPGTDVGSHGTHVAGIAAAVGDNGIGVTGVSWAATIIPVASLGADGSGSSSQIAAGFAYAADNGARIVNASLGTCPLPSGTPPPSDEADVIAAHPNTLFVVAAGNANPDCTIGGQNDDDVNPIYPCDIPAPNLVCVARSQADDSLASNSDYGRRSVDLAAPGGRILSTYPHTAGGSAGVAEDSGSGAYAYDNGTSMATPMVSGVAGLVLARNPWSSTAQLKDALLAGVDPKAPFAATTVSGGRLNARGAIIASDDTTAPAAFSLSAPADGTANGETRPTVSWGSSSDAKSGLDHYDVLVDGAVAATTGATSAQVDAGEGTHTIAVRAVDRAGNTTTTPTATITVDRTAPSNPGSGSPLNGAILNTARPAIAWSAASDGGSGLAGYDVGLDGGPATRVDATATSFTPAQALGQGVHAWSVKAVDRAGNASGALTGAFFIDTVAPGRPGGASPEDGGATRDRTPRLSWDAVSDAGAGLAYYEVVLDGAAPVRVSETSFVPDRALRDGGHDWSVRAVDRAGNASPLAGGSFAVDTKSPAASATAASASAGRVRVRCRSREAGRCAVRVLASAGTAKRLGLGRRTTTLGSASAALKTPGRSLTIRLSAKARRALRRAGSARLVVRVTVTDRAGNATRTTTTVRAR